MYFLNI